MPNATNSKGFTLIEIIVVIALMAILTIAAFTNSFSAQKTFAFMGAFKQVLSTIQLPRNYAMTQTSVARPNGPISPLAYGANINKNGQIITIFGDSPGDFSLDPPTTSTTIGQYGGPCTEPDYSSCDDTIGTPYKLDSTKYEIKFFNASRTEITPDFLNLFYSPPYGSFFANKTLNNTVTKISSNDDSYLSIEVSDKNDSNLKSCIIIFTKTGIVEPYDPNNLIMRDLKTPCNPQD